MVLLLLLALLVVVVVVLLLLVLLLVLVVVLLLVQLMVVVVLLLVLPLLLVLLLVVVVLLVDGDGGSIQCNYRLGSRAILEASGPHRAVLELSRPWLRGRFRPRSGAACENLGSWRPLVHPRAILGPSGPHLEPSRAVLELLGPQQAVLESSRPWLRGRFRRRSGAACEGMGSLRQTGPSRNHIGAIWVRSGVFQHFFATIRGRIGPSWNAD